MSDTVTIYFQGRDGQPDREQTIGRVTAFRMTDSFHFGRFEFDTADGQTYVFTTHDVRGVSYPSDKYALIPQEKGKIG